MFTKPIAEGAAIVGQPCWYGNIIVEVLKVHNDAEPPYHTILMPNGTEINTVREKLTLASAAEIAQWDTIGKQLNSHLGPSSAEIAQRDAIGKQLRPFGAVKETKAKMMKMMKAKPKPKANFQSYEAQLKAEVMKPKPKDEYDEGVKGIPATQIECNDCGHTGTLEGGEFYDDLGIKCQNCYSVDTKASLD
jgi:hypothetical protein